MVTLIPAPISNCIFYKVWDEIIHPFPNFSGATVEVWEWISNFIQHYWACDYLSMHKSMLIQGRRQKLKYPRLPRPVYLHRVESVKRLRYLSTCSDPFHAMCPWMPMKWASMGTYHEIGMIKLVKVNNITIFTSASVYISRKYISIQWRNCSSTAFTKIIPVISTHVSIILLNIHPTLLPVHMFRVVLLLLLSL